MAEDQKYCFEALDKNFDAQQNYILTSLLYTLAEINPGVDMLNILRYVYNKYTFRWSVYHDAYRQLPFDPLHRKIIYVHPHHMNNRVKYVLEDDEQHPDPNAVIFHQFGLIAAGVLVLEANKHRNLFQYWWKCVGRRRKFLREYYRMIFQVRKYAQRFEAAYMDYRRAESKPDVQKIRAHEQYAARHGIVYLKLLEIFRKW